MSFFAASFPICWHVTVDGYGATRLTHAAWVSYKGAICQPSIRLRLPKAQLCFENTHGGRINQTSQLKKASDLRTPTFHLNKDIVRESTIEMWVKAAQLQVHSGLYRLTFTTQHGLNSGSRLFKYIIFH